jgi:hypothetical protein
MPTRQQIVKISAPNAAQAAPCRALLLYWYGRWNLGQIKEQREAAPWGVAQREEPLAMAMVAKCLSGLGKYRQLKRTRRSNIPVSGVPSLTPVFVVETERAEWRDRGLAVIGEVSQGCYNKFIFILYGWRCSRRWEERRG